MCAMRIKLFVLFFLSLYLMIHLSNESSSNEKCYFVNQQNKETWKLVWQDNFQSENYTRKNWVIDDGNCVPDWDKQLSCGIKDNVKLIDGCLVMRAKEEKYGQWNFTSAMLVTNKEFGYGRFEIRAALSVDNDVWSIFSTRTKNIEWAKDGYFITGRFDNVSKSYQSAVFPNKQRVSKYNQFDIDYSAFHLYGMEWSEKEVNFFVDDHYSEPILLNATRMIKPEQQIQLWLGITDDYGPLPDKNNWKCPLLIVDYVRVYEKIFNPNVGLKLELCEEQNDVDQSSKKQRELVNLICGTKISTTTESTTTKIVHQHCNPTSNSALEISTPIQNQVDQSYGNNFELCGIDWEAYKDEKCYQILQDENPIHSFDSAIEKCASLEDMSTLTIIESCEEQNFLSNFLFNIHKKVDNFWIGAKYSNTSNSFKWLDNSELSFTNWHSNYQTKMGFNNSCVLMQAEKGLVGKWKNEPCTNRNAVVCQKMQLWPIEQLQKSFLNARREIKELKKKLKV